MMDESGKSQMALSAAIPLNESTRWRPALLAIAVTLTVIGFVSWTVAPRDFLRFLFEWQRVTPATRMQGSDAMLAILDQEGV